MASFRHQTLKRVAQFLRIAPRVETVGASKVKVTNKYKSGKFGAIDAPVLVQVQPGKRGRKGIGRDDERGPVALDVGVVLGRGDRAHVAHKGVVGNTLL